MKKSIMLMIMVPILICLVLTSIFAKNLMEYFGNKAVHITMIVLAISLCTVPFLSYIKLFAGHGIRFFWGKNAAAKKVLQTGRPALATVKFIGHENSGMQVRLNKQPILKLVLDIQPYDGQMTYETNLVTLIPYHIIPQFQPGISFKVKIDNTNPQNIVFDGTA